MEAGRVNISQLIRTLMQLLAGAWLLLSASALAAESGPDRIAPSCHARAADPAGARALLASESGWICADRDWSATSRLALVRFELGTGGRVPAELLTRLARFESLSVRIDRADGSAALYPFSHADLISRGHMTMALALPEQGTPARRITVTVTGATVTPLLSTMRLNTSPTPVLGPEQLLLGLLCGVLLVPLFFNLALYRALRDRFLVWHVAVVAFMLSHTAVTSGMVPLFVSVPVGTVSTLIVVTLCGAVVSAIMLASEFIEPDKISPAQRRMLHLAALWTVLNVSFFLTTIDSLQAYAVNLYFANWLPVIAVFCWCLAAAYRQGSRAAKFLIASWLPLILTSLWQIGDVILGHQSEPIGLFLAQRVAIGLEVLIGSIGIADRFIQLRRDRDDTLVLAGEMARLAERDALTGLLNRRAIERRFAALRRSGFATLALLDLDHFKTVNDRHGHAVGDSVLQSVAAALANERDVLAVRLGGEEFLLLLRGPLPAQRAEHLRQSITTRTAHDLPGLDRPVTASMGLVEIPTAVIPDATFAAIYARADGLLYQAKRAGRNRTVSERMTVFAGHKAKAA